MAEQIYLRIFYSLFQNIKIMNRQSEHVAVRKYFCVHCRDESMRFLCYSFGTLENVYGHWLSNHTELPVAKPFLFYAVDLVGCHYCAYTGLCGRLCHHHDNKHPNESLAITRPSNRQQCALCFHTGPDLGVHFMQTHELVLEANIFNPVCLTPDTLAELLTIDIHRKRLCEHCGATFETDHEANEHHYDMHTDERKSVIQTNDVQPNQISHLICGLCNATVRPEHYFGHIEMDQSIFQISNASFQGDPWESYYQKLYMDYLRTKVVFGNRLVVFKQNLIFSEYDDSQQFADLANRLVACAFGQPIVRQ